MGQEGMDQETESAETIADRWTDKLSVRLEGLRRKLVGR